MVSSQRTPHHRRVALTYRTKPFKHQAACLREYGPRAAFALLAEMGTGKTWIIISNVSELWAKGECDALLVLAPNGVHENWTRIELPKHMPTGVEWTATAWTASQKKSDIQRLKAIVQPSSALRILTMNWEALQTKRGREMAEQFCKSASHLMIACDESDNIKNPAAERTKALFKLRPYSRWRRIMTGTPIDGTPFSAFAQYNFLDPSILKTTSYTTFKATYAEMLQPGNPLLTAIITKNKLRFVPQVVARDAANHPKYRDLDKLRALINPHSFRVLKSECLDLPKKVYKSIIFEMTPKQAAIYKKAEDECRLEYELDSTPFNKLAIATKLSQITSGYYIHPKADEPVRIPGGNPKMDITVERAQAILGMGKKLIIWARYTIQIEDIVLALRHAGITEVVQYYGAIKKSARAEAIDDFERGPAKIFVGNQQAGGSGITLVAASYVYYFSNNYSLRDRLQSEDRAHRIGQTDTVTYIDVAAKGTVDEAVIESMGVKRNVADVIIDNKFKLFS